MTKIEPRYRQFPYLVKFKNEQDPWKSHRNTERRAVWLNDMKMDFNREFVRYFHDDDSGDTIYAFKEKWQALQFKLATA